MSTGTAGEPDPDEYATSDVSTTPDRQLPPPGTLKIEPVYEALGHPRRRYLCYTLLEATEWSLTDLATKTAAWEDGVPEHAVTDAQRLVSVARDRYWSVRAFGHQLARRPLPAAVALGCLVGGTVGEGRVPLPDVVFPLAVVLGALGLAYVGSGRL